MKLAQLSATVAALLLCLNAGAQSPLVRDFAAACDSLQAGLQRRTSVNSTLRLTRVLKRGESLDFYFNQNLRDYPWREADLSWLRATLKEHFPATYKHFHIGEIYAVRTPVAQLAVTAAGNDGRPTGQAFRIRDPKGRTFVHDADAPLWSKGLSGRHIALWQSHGRYFEAKTDRWEWQRAPIFRTVEDLYTQSYVVPFLMPMLENAGAYVMSPRERDPQPCEVVCDNDAAFDGPRGEGLRRKGSYAETGRWTDAGSGFADAKPFYTGSDNPFTMGSARQVEVKDGKARAEWTPDIPERGEYAVYVSYKSLPNSSEAARYTVRHLGGESRFIVNQRIGGGTWIYLGTFTFAAGKGGSVTLDNGIPEGYQVRNKAVVSADAVRFGGGMGKIGRGREDAPAEEYRISQVPAFVEGALYNMQWSGLDMALFDEWETDYTKDYAGRGRWTSYLAGGSRAIPGEEGLGIPFDLSLAFHSDAGTTPNDSIVGTLSIYSLTAVDKTTLPDGTSRYACRELADYVQTQLVNDIRSEFEPEWSRRFLWERSYSESRTTGVPAMLLELLSHQNFADMKYGLDPAFRFTASRAVYKGILKFLANRYGCAYAVQPLPVQDFAVQFADGLARAELSWRPTEDPLEPTALPRGYLLRTRVDDGAFDSGTVIEGISRADGKLSVRVAIEKGHVYSFQIVAFNDGGRSFPSETLAIGVPRGASEAGKVMIVNNFTRVSAPAWFDTPTFAGFDGGHDGGVAWGYEINYLGPQYQFRRELPWVDDDNPGFGASYINEAGKRIPGNTFDFPAVHGRAFFQEGYAFASCCASAFSTDGSLRDGYAAIDLICGKQVTTPMGRGAVANRYQVFPAPLQAALRDYTAAGGNVLLSGAYIGTDVWDQVYPVTVDAAYTEGAKSFVQEVLGYQWLTDYATAEERILPYRNDKAVLRQPLSFHRLPCAGVYHVESPDGILPADERGSVILRYGDTDISAGVAYQGEGYRSVALGFPIEVLGSEADIRAVIAAALGWFNAP